MRQNPGYWLYAITYAFIYTLNAYGKTKISMLYSFCINTFVIIGAAFLVLRKDNLNNYDLLIEIAIVNLAVRTLGTFILGYFIYKEHILHEEIRNNKGELISESIILLRLSLSNLVEPISYHITQIVLTKLIAIIGIYALIVRGYILSISALLETVALAISRGSQIVIGYYIGSKEYPHADKQLKISIYSCLALSAILSFPIFLFRINVMQIFTQDVDIITFGENLIVISMIVMFLKCITFNLCGGLKAAGDVRFLAKIFLTIPWFCTIPLCFTSIIFIDKNIYFIWCSFIIEEIIKIWLLVKRWKQGQWKQGVLVTNKELHYELP